MVGTLTAMVAIPMFILNSLAGIVGGIWLIYLGEWKLVVAGFWWRWPRRFGQVF